MAIGAQRDIDATRAQLAQWICPRLGADAAEVPEITAPWNGFSNETLLFDVHWRRRGEQRTERLVARVKPPVHVFPEYDLRKQYRAMELMGPTGVPVPRMRWYEDDPAVLGAPFFVMDRIDGAIPPDNPTYHVADVCASWSPESRRAAWLDGVAQMARIHRLDWRAAGFGWLDQPRWGPTGLAQQLGYYRHYLGWATDGHPHPTCDPGLRWLEEHAPREERLGLSWGDARVGNMIFADDRCAAVLDWEMAAILDPEADLAWWLFLDWHHSAGFGIDRLAGFPDPSETVAAWEARVDRPARHLPYYEVFAAFRFAVIMIRIAALTAAANLPIPENFAVDNVPSRRLAELLEAR